MKQRLVMLALAAGCIVLAVAGALVYLGHGPEGAGDYSGRYGNQLYGRRRL